MLITCSVADNTPNLFPSITLFPSVKTNWFQFVLKQPMLIAKLCV